MSLVSKPVGCCR